MARDSCLARVTAGVAVGGAVGGAVVMADGDGVMVGRLRMTDLWEPSLVEEEALRLLEVRFGGPTKHWIDAIPIGNGRLGAIPIGRRRCTDLATEKHTSCELYRLRS